MITKEKKTTWPPGNATASAVAGALRHKKSAHPMSSVSHETLKESIEAVRTEIGLDRPNTGALSSLLNDANAALAATFLKAAEDIQRTGKTDALGSTEVEMAKRVADLQELEKQIRLLAEHRTAAINQETKRLNATQNVDKVTPSNEDAEMTAITREELDAKLDAVRADGKSLSAEIRADSTVLRSEMNTLRSDMLLQFANMRTDFANSTAALRHDFSTTANSMSQSVARLEGSVDGLKSSISMFQSVMALIVAGLGAWLAYEQLSEAKKVSSTPATISAPVANAAPQPVIPSPQAVTTPPPPQAAPAKQQGK